MQPSTLHFSICCIFDIGAEIVTNSIFLDFSLLLFTVSGLNTFQKYSIINVLKHYILHYLITVVGHLTMCQSILNFQCTN